MEKVIWIRGGIVLKLMVVIVSQSVIELNKGRGEKMSDYFYRGVYHFNSRSPLVSKY
jgi:hypothetical protein